MPVIEDFTNYFGLYMEEGLRNINNTCMSTVACRIGDGKTLFMPGEVEGSLDKILVLNRENENMLMLRFATPEAIETLIGVLEHIKLTFNKDI